MSNRSFVGNDLLKHTRSILTTTPRRWLELAETLSPDLLNFQPKAGEWSAVECLMHILDVEKVFQFRLQAFLKGKPQFPAFDPEEQKTSASELADAAGLATEFARLRHESLIILEALVPSDLERKSRHAELGPVTLAQLIHEWAAHDLNHTIQAERALIQPFIKGCGPWQQYFTDQIIQE